MRWLLLILCIPLLLEARPKRNPVVDESNVPYVPWFTGPLLAPTPVNMERGHPAILPAVAVFNIYGEFDDHWKFQNDTDTWVINPLVDFQTAFTERTGVEFIVSSVTNFRDGMTSTQLEDTLVFFGYQVSDDTKDTWIPDFRLFLDTIFPTGRHDQLEPSLEGIDSSGQGAYFLGPNLSFQKLFYLEKNFFSLHWSFGYLFPLRTDVNGHSVYGGGDGTRGTLVPGQMLIAFLSGEYSFNQNWVFQFDTQYLYQRASSDFRGNPGIDDDGTPFDIGLEASFELGVTLGLEYNFTKDTGILFGTWFSAAGFNTDAFAGLYFGAVHIF